MRDIDQKKILSEESRLKHRAHKNELTEHEKNVWLLTLVISAVFFIAAIATATTIKPEGDGKTPVVMMIVFAVASGIALVIAAFKLITHFTAIKE